jgi:hypothetical protein
MSSKKRMMTDLLFGVQILAACVLCGSQFVRALETVKGISLSMLLLMEIYLMLHFMLALGAHRTNPSRLTRQTIATYTIWLVLIGTNIFAVFKNSEYHWSSNDSHTVALVAIGTACLLALGHLQKLRHDDPMLKSLLAMLCKALPQFMLALKVMQEGGAGLPGAAIVSGNFSILIRLVQVGLTVREGGWERNRTWLLLSETANELSWATVSIVWLIWILS